MLNTSRLIIGILLMIVGAFFLILSLFEAWGMIFFSVLLLVMGIIILLNKNEDKIEKRKDIKEKEYHK